MEYYQVPARSLHRDLGESKGTLWVYGRSGAGLLADDGSRWGVLILPGGGYERIAPAESEPVALAFVAAGMQAFVLSYSLLPVGWPAQFLEGAAAMAWIRNHAAQLGIRSDRVAVCGFSAGGHLAGCLCCLWDHQLLREQLGLAPEQVRPDAAILGYPVINETRYLAPLGAPEELQLNRRMRGDHPPAFLWATGEDATVPVENTLDYASALRRAGVPAELHLFAKGPHAMGLADRESARDMAHYNSHAAAWHGLCVDWLKGV